jgi:ribonuclease P protein component
VALPKFNRLRSKKDFDSVFKKGKTVKNSFLFIKYAVNDLDILRFGFIVPKSISGKAVTRNRIKRILSDTTGKIIYKIKGGYDIAVTITAKNIDLSKAIEQTIKDQIESAVKILYK